MKNLESIIQRLRLLCRGKPAKIAWPHRELHEAADLLEEALTALTEVKDAKSTNIVHALATMEISHATYIKCGLCRLKIEGDT